MSKQAISLTLDADNLTWLRGRVSTVGARSVSEVLDRLIADARAAGSGPSRSVVGTIDIDPEDPLLAHADEAVRAMYAISVSRPSMVKEAHATYGARPSRTRKRRG